MKNIRENYCGYIREEQNVPEDPFQEIRDDYEDEVRYNYLDECARMGLPNPLSRNPTGI